MRPASPFEEQIRGNLRKVEARPEFAGNRLWLTFYLMGPPDNLERLADALKKGDWANMVGWDGGFLYPKVQVEKAVSAIVEAAQRAQQLCAEHGAEILNIDADTTPDPSSRCVTLYQSPT